MASTKQKSALLIAGPTASGKSALAVRLAKERDGVVINADALQVYRELNVLSARPSVEEASVVPHRLYGHVSGANPYSVAAWLADVIAEIETVWSKGKLPIIVGGTGLYFMALEQGLASVPPIDPTTREKWRGFEGDIHGELLRRDPAYAAKLKPNDRQRIARALEVIESTGQSLLNWQAQAQQSAFLKDVQVERIMVDVPRTELYVQADQRFDLMIAHGAIEEVRAVAEWDQALPMMRAIGVPELVRHLRGELNLAEASALAKIATRQFIKRQLTWGRGQAKEWARVTPHGKPNPATGD